MSQDDATLVDYPRMSFTRSEVPSFLIPIFGLVVAFFIQAVIQKFAGHALPAAFLVLFWLVAIVLVCIGSRWALSKRGIPRPVLVISSEGVLEREVIKELIPWMSIHKINLRERGQYREQKLISLTLTAAFTAELRSRIAKKSAGKEEQLELFIIASQLQGIKADDLLLLMRRYRDRFGRPLEGDTSKAGERVFDSASWTGSTDE